MAVGNTDRGSKEHAPISLQEPPVTDELLNRSATLPHPGDGNPMGYLYRVYVRPARLRMLLAILAATLGGVTALVIPQALRHLIDSLAAHPQASALWAAIGLLTLLGLFEGAMFLLRRQFNIKPAVAIERRMREDLFARLQRLPVRFHDRVSSGQLLSRAMGDLSLVRRYLAFGAIFTVVSTVMIIVGLVMMWLLDWRFFLLYACIVPLILVLSYVFRNRFHTASREVMDLQGDLATTVEESVHGVRILKSFGRADFSTSQLTAQLGGLRRAEIYKAHTLGWFIGVIVALPNLIVAAALVWGVVLISRGEMSVGTVVAFFATARVLTNPLEDLGQLIGMYISTKAAMQRHVETMSEELEILSPEAPAHPQGRGALEFRNISFRFADTEKGVPDLLHGIDLTLRPGETMALVGATGSGKSTLLNLVPRLYEATGGQVLVDGVPVEKLDLEDLRTRVAVTYEEATLFSDSVFNNVMLGVTEEDPAERQRIFEQALEVAQGQFVSALPEGPATQIGEEGLSLSGGQRQRLALARAVAAAPQIMVLDDPLSALDVSTEERVIAALGQVLSGTTTLIVAHRPSTVALADRVAVLQDGTITAVDTHQNLLAHNDHYRHLISSLSAEQARASDSIDAAYEARQNQQERENAQTHAVVTQEQLEERAASGRNPGTRSPEGANAEQQKEDRA